MRLGHLLEVTMQRVTIYVYVFDEHAHIKGSLCIYKGLPHEVYRHLPSYQLTLKVCGVMADNNELVISCYDAEDTEFLEIEK